MSTVTTQETFLPLDLNPDHIGRTSSHKHDHLETEAFKIIFMFFAKLQLGIGTKKFTAIYFDQV